MNFNNTTFTKSLKAAFATVLLMLSLNVYAITLSDAMTQLPTAKAQGWVGEQPNGYLGVVNPSAQAQEIANLINQARKAEYQKMAQANNIKLQDVEQLAGQKAIQKTHRGHLIQQNGQWVKKP
ncbi:YdbL family protein [Thiomicrorhabdus aquaedulcis]|uniref:YdbL family protein n=1 Tax=Thiomicrorhabdus aquaedulcis TaxID=2211106 RepID=UPI000FD8C08E|nr:YdbL family protein [Thiomicrorhabdus aquaedulcis]